VLDIQLVRYIIFYKYSSSKYKQSVCLHHRLYSIFYNIIIVLFVEIPRKFITAKQTYKQNYYIFYRHQQTYKELIFNIITYFSQRIGRYTRSLTQASICPRFYKRFVINHAILASTTGNLYLSKPDKNFRLY
jgi:hypothetical protein